jgi:hypothetical protein
VRRSKRNMNGKPDVLKLVEKQTGKSYGERRKIILPPIFENVAICMGCGKEKHVNASGFCEDCWVQFSHLRRKA